MSVLTRNTKRVLYLFSSAPPNRPNYKRGVLNALCYPAKHCMELNYQKSYISPTVFDNRDAWKDHEGYFVFIDYRHDGDLVFIPIRKFKVQSIYPAEQAQEYAEGTRIYVRIQLEELILFNDDYNQKIRNIPGRPVPHMKPPAFYYALEYEDFSPEISKRSQRDIWDDLVEHVAQAKSLNDCVFLSTGNIRQIGNDKDCDFVSYGKDQAAQKAYQVRPNTVYKLDLRVYDLRHTPDSAQEIMVRSSSDLLSVSQPFATTVGGPSDHSVLIACKRTIENTLATLEVDVKQQVDLPDAEKKDGEKTRSAKVISAKPVYMLSISVSKALLLWFIVFVFLGVLLTSTSKEFFDDICFTHPTFWAVAAKFIGAVFVAIAAYLGFRKLPSGSA